MYNNVITSNGSLEIVQAIPTFRRFGISYFILIFLKVQLKSNFVHLLVTCS